MSKIHELTGPEKAAILLLSLGQDKAARVLKELRDEEVSEVVTEIAALHVVEQGTVTEIVEVFSETRKQDEALCRGGLNQARELLAAAVDPDKVEEILALIDQGVITPAKVERSALQNAASVAAMLLTTDCAIVDAPVEDDGGDDHHHHDHGQ